ncbi:hypothetical protein RCL1_003968 [Eukaryota sp. TZLM3-RCL]
MNILQEQDVEKLPTIPPLPKGKAPEFLPSPLIELARLVVRAFHERFSWVVYDSVLRCGVVFDEELAERMQIPVAAVRTELNNLYSHKLLDKETVKMPRGAGGQRDYYFVDWKKFLDTVQYKFFKVEHTLKAKIDMVQDEIKYECTNKECKQIYLPLDVPRLLNEETLTLQCENCESVLRETERTEHSQRLLNEQQTFNRELRQIKALLTECLRLKIPKENTRDVTKVLTKNDHVSLQHESSIGGSRLNKSRRPVSSLARGGSKGDQVHMASGNLKMNFIMLDESGAKVDLSSALPPVIEVPFSKPISVPEFQQSTSLPIPVLDVPSFTPAAPVTVDLSIAPITVPQESQEDSVHVMVAGSMKKLSEITPEDEQQMNDKEFEDYYAIKQELFGE